VLHNEPRYHCADRHDDCHGNSRRDICFLVIVDPPSVFRKCCCRKAENIGWRVRPWRGLQKKQKQRDREQLLADLNAEENIRNQQLQQVLGMEAQKLAALAIQAIKGGSSATRRRLK